MTRKIIAAILCALVVVNALPTSGIRDAMRNSLVPEFEQTDLF